MRAIPSVVTLASLICTAALAMVWWGDGTYAALSLATGYTAALLLPATLLVTPIHRLRRRRSAPIHLPLRRSLGVHAGLLAILHMVVSFPVHLGGDVVRFFFDPDGGFLVTRFGLSNWLGLVAIVMFVVLLLTSTDGSLRWLGARRWKRLHLLAFAAAVLTALHALGYQTFRHAWVGSYRYGSSPGALSRLRGSTHDPPLSVPTTLEDTEPIRDGNGCVLACVT